ncbi:MAG: hypothetical protein C0501_00065 [Isosphaera sp.]|nr:hypothetical protein [Isosphaera sp.]
MADEHPTPVELFLLILVANGVLPPAAWDDFRQFLAPPVPPPDPAPGVEFAPRELPEPVAAQVYAGISRIAADNPQREAERAKNPPAPDELVRRMAAHRAKLARLRRELNDLGGELHAEIEPRDPPV